MINLFNYVKLYCEFYYNHKQIRIMIFFNCQRYGLQVHNVGKKLKKYLNKLPVSIPSTLKCKPILLPQGCNGSVGVIEQCVWLRLL